MVYQLEVGVVYSIDGEDLSIDNIDGRHLVDGVFNIYLPLERTNWYYHTSNY